MSDQNSSNSIKTIPLREAKGQNSKLTIAILGSGAWGTTLASLASQNGHHVRVWSRQSSLCLEAVLENAEIVLSAISMKGVGEVAANVQKAVSSKPIFVTATKGLDPVTTCTPSQIWQAAFPTRPVVVLSGPNLAKEIQQGLPAATVVASRDAAAASSVQAVFSSPSFRVYTNADPLGVELGGTLKNVMAIAAGTCDGLQLGTNAKAALLTRGLTEIIRIGNCWGAQPETFYGLSGLGDLLATCNSSLSRNYQVGYRLAQGKTLSEVLTELEGTAEGVNTASVLIQRADREEISVPISYQVYRLLKGEVTPLSAVEALMLRDSKPEYS
ncbi:MULTISPECIES: NAD(P)H-dependent glycerol-3-phosphate dehydrogenase [unclassified Coleofasciculus]|uniref:NAD(P)H-dependent glycerol-3-phosphate dehydrogenase n=1 Tax=Cyanophyceae TaxID=3028117 RepID=UPI0016869B90|nr:MULTISPECIES: NAD(P)H-dependent glycerol-3-phosphate dehydrogenase [unclassified Coleofasciculus]MBD1880464.1 NAD(P)H-dependent glycerol-3-phosphate dehydrogenase [Coleofasciculus sp. FACHB-T130]MBD1897012.1 NAD(P)H-dependent glycerol-3-phosphate dehydrogenase [Coleofasciculus sp. FACHB-129]MBD1901144.1 NAD(P)H-dependent glycerol-3-phosphate dehydrogenase [Coleofasciculus sp. FACHB-125]